MCAVVGITWFGLPLAGLQITGVALLAAYIVYFLCAYFVARRLTAFQLTTRVARLLLLLIAVAASVAALAARQLFVDSMAAIGLALAMTAFCAVRIVRLTATGRANADRVFAVIGRLRKGDGH